MPADRIHVLQNWGDASSVNVDARGAYALRQKYGITDHAIFAVHLGNIGAATGVETLIEAFEFLWNDENICMLIAGVGSRLQACQELVEKKACRIGSSFTPPGPKKTLGPS